MKVNQSIVVGIKALSALKGKTRPIRAQDLAVEIGESCFYLEQILRKLRIANLVQVQRGPGGGVSLDPLRDHITAQEVALAVHGSFKELQKSSESVPTTLLHKLDTAIYKAFSSIQI